MSIKMSKTKLFFFYAALLITGLIVCHDVVPIVIANNLYQEFAESAGVINYMLTGPGLLLILSSVVTGELLKKYSQKTMLLVGCVLFIIGGLGGGLVRNVYYMAVMRSIVGLSAGIVNVAAVAMISAVFTDENKNASMMGIYNAAGSACGVFLSMAAGWLAVVNWQLAFMAYCPIVLVLILSIFFLPEIKPQADAEAAKEATVKEPLGTKFWLFIAAYFVYDMVCVAWGYYSSLYVAENGLGNEAFAGLVNSMYTVGGFVFGMAFGFLYKKFKRASSAPIIIGTILAGGAMYLFPGKATAVIGYLFFGGIYIMMFSFAYAVLPTIVSPSNVDRAIGISTATYALASFVGSYVVTGLMNALHTDGAITPVFLPCLGIMLIPLVIEFIGMAMDKKKPAESK